MAGDEKPRILVVDDEENLREGIRDNLLQDGYEVELAKNGEEGLACICSNDYDLVILDVMMPKLDGFTVCEEARAAGKEMPILFLTAKGGVADRIQGLEVGGDDYLAKPFHLRELLLRVAAILRRRTWYGETPASGSSIAFEGNEVDFRNYRGTAFDGQVHQLTQKEAMILKCLVERSGEVVSREEILERVWGYDLYPSTRTIDNFIVRLRKRFERDHEAPQHFHTVRGVGYRFTKEPETT